MGSIVTPFEDINPFGTDACCEDLYNYIWYLTHKRNRYECNMNDAESFICPFCDWLAAMTLANWALSADLDIEDDLKQKIDTILKKRDYNTEKIPDYPTDGINHCDDDYVFEPGDNLHEWLVDSAFSVTDRAIQRCADMANGPGNEILYMYQERGAGAKPSLKLSAMDHMIRSIRYSIMPLMSTMLDMGVGCELCEVNDTSTNYPRISSAHISPNGILRVNGAEYNAENNDVAIIVAYNTYDENGSDTVEIIIKSAVIGLLDNVSNAVVISFTNTEYGTQSTKDILESLKKHGLKRILMTVDAGGDGSIMEFMDVAEYPNAFQLTDIGSKNYTRIVSSQLVPTPSIMRYVAEAFDDKREVIDAVVFYKTIMHDDEYEPNNLGDYCDVPIKECVINAYNALGAMFYENTNAYAIEAQNIAEKGLETPYRLNGILALKCLLYDLNITRYIRESRKPTKFRAAHEFIMKSGIEMLDEIIERNEMSSSNTVTISEMFKKRSESIIMLAHEYGLEFAWDAFKKGVPIDDLFPASYLETEWFAEMHKKITATGSEQK